MPKRKCDANLSIEEISVEMMEEPFSCIKGTGIPSRFHQESWHLLGSL